MLQFLCGLTPAQWALMPHQDTATTTVQPEGYVRSGLYEGETRLWIIQYSGDHVYRYWPYERKYAPAIAPQEQEDLLELALKANENAAAKQRRAEQLMDEAERLRSAAGCFYRRALLRERDE